MTQDETKDVKRTSLEDMAREFVLLLSRQEFDRATETFTGDMVKAAPPEVLKNVWNEQIQENGAFLNVDGTRSEAKGPYHKVFVTCEFEKHRLDLSVVFDDDDKIAGLSVVHEHRAPDYAKRDAFKELDVAFGQGEWVLPGTLSVPEGDGPFPAVVLVHGSGPNDRDESVGAAKPFRDLAWGLSSRGIVVLRYEKRTRHHAKKLAEVQNVTVWDETIDDALEAVSFLRKNEHVCEHKVFVLGHSLGATMIPRIAAGKAEIAGYVVMAAAARPREDLLLEQTLYHASLADQLSAEDQAKVEEIHELVATIKDISEDHDPTEHVFGARPSYWLDLKGYNPAEAAKAIRQPMLVLQGEKDYQVLRRKDFELWRNALADKENAQFKVYPSLNHLFVKACGKSTGAEYFEPGNVDVAVVEDIAEWIKRIL